MKNKILSALKFIVSMLKAMIHVVSGCKHKHVCDEEIPEQKNEE